jgi:hypothetical protein
MSFWKQATSTRPGVRAHLPHGGQPLANAFAHEGRIKNLDTENQLGRSTKRLRE